MIQERAKVLQFRAIYGKFSNVCNDFVQIQIAVIQNCIKNIKNVQFSVKIASSGLIILRRCKTPTVVQSAVIIWIYSTRFARFSKTRFDWGMKFDDRAMSGDPLCVKVLLTTASDWYSKLGTDTTASNQNKKNNRDILAELC